MWTHAPILFCVQLLTATCSIAYTLGPPAQGLDGRSHFQQALGATTIEDEDDASLILSDPQKVIELFWTLTTDDAIPPLDQADTKNYQIQRNHIAFHQQETRPSAEAQKYQDLQTDHPASLEVYMSTIGGYPIYHTPIALGKPAQPFRAWLNMGLNGLYVRSSACSKQDCGGDGFSYNGTESKARRSLEQRFEVYPKGWTVGGNISTDTLHLAGLEVEGAMVGEIDKYEGEELFYYVMEFVVDG